MWNCGGENRHIFFLRGLKAVKRRFDVLVRPLGFYELPNASHQRQMRIGGINNLPGLGFALGKDIGPQKQGSGVTQGADGHVLQREA